MSSLFQVNSYAKINWTLDILFKREDGYHELQTIYQTVSLHDRLRITESADAIEIACDDLRVPCNETNLIFKAATLLREAARITKGARIEIDKRIPVAAGLGGGSSNAATTLLALVKLWRLEIDQRELTRIASALGSDVPFFLIGGTAMGVGRGEQVHPVEQVSREHLLLVNPGFAVSTRDAYEGYARLTRPEPASIMPFTLPTANGVRELPLAARNDLEEVVLASYPEIAEVKRRLIAAGARHAVMSGSGATVFGVFDNSQVTERAESEMRALGYWTERVRTVDQQEYQATIFS
ncbi:MAG TPA: 4-(cytidine 5'-diphospho)-2-C-methyl-D-erythritol kinase [Blastocatellia bacterium]